MHQHDSHDDLTPTTELRPIPMAGHAQPPPALAESATEKAPKRELKSRRRPENWRLLASFAIEFQARLIGQDHTTVYRTTVHHMETDKDASWPGIEGKRLCAWMLEQLSEEAKLKAAEAALNKVEPAPTTPVAISVTQVLAFQPSTAQTPVAIGKPGRVFQGVLNSFAPFALEAEFHLADFAAGKAAHETTYDAQFLVNDLVTGTKMALGASATRTLVAGQTVYRARLPDIRLAPGIYRIRAVVTLYHTPRTFALLEIPLFRVI